MKFLFKADIAIMFLLGISSGLPLALILSTIKVFLVDFHFDIKTIGFFSLISIPYSLKFLWAPLLDYTSIPFVTKKLGRRRSWIIISQILLIISIVALGFFKDRDVFVIALIAILIAIFSATQDMAIDAYRIEKIETKDQGIVSSIYVYGYRIGMLISGAFALILSSKMPWDMVYYTVSATMLIGVFAIFLAKEEKPNTNPKEQLLDPLKKSFGLTNKYFFHSIIVSLNQKDWHLIFPLIALFKLCDSFAGSLTLPFLIDVGFNKIEIATIVKTFGLFSTLSGAMIGGIFVKKFGLLKSLWISLILQAISNLAFCYQAYLGHNVPYLYLTIFIENFSGGIGDSVFITYLSSLCNISFTATRYAILVSIASISRTFVSSLAGIFVASFGWIAFFLFSSTLGIPALILLFLLIRKNNYQLK